MRSRDSDAWRDVNEREFAALPRVGEHIEFGEDQNITLYRVVAVCYVQTPRCPKIDIYAVRPRRTDELFGQWKKQGDGP